MAKAIEKKTIKKNLSAKEFERRLTALHSPAELIKIQGYFKSGKGQYGEGDQFLGVRMGQLFALAKEFIDMPITELEKLLDHKIHEMRAGALSIMDKQSRRRKMSEADRKALFDLYMRRHDRINNWDLVDVSCIHVVGQYLADKPRDILYKLARSRNMWERRTAIVSTAYFLKSGDVKDTFKIAELLIHDKEDLIHKAVGGWVRHAGRGKFRPELIAFLDKYGATMPRVALRYAIEHLDAKLKKYYMQLGAG